MILSRLHALGAIALEPSLALAAGIAAPATVMAPFWRGVDSIYLDCTLPEGGCRLAGKLLGDRAPVPVRVLAPGEAAPDAIGAVVVTVRAVTNGGAESIEIAAHRAASVDDSQGSLRPRRFAQTGDVAATLHQAFNRVLPWRAAVD